MRLCRPLSSGSLVRAELRLPANLNDAITQMSRKDIPTTKTLKRLSDLWYDLYGTPDFDERRTELVYGHLPD